MTTAGDIAFWDVLKDRALPSRLDTLTARLVFSWDNLKHPALVLSCFLLLVFASMCFKFLVSSRAQNLMEDHIHTRSALQVLVAVVVPTCSFWPSRYIELASILPSYINIPFEMILEDTINGTMEFRNPGNDLAVLMDLGATVDGHTIYINIEWKWWVRYFKWRMLPESELGLSVWLHRDMPATNSGPLDLSPCPLALTSSTLSPLQSLGCLPHNGIPAFNANRKVTREFMVFSPSLRTFSTAQVISAIPFMISERPRRRPQPLVSVLKELSASYGPNLVINSISNVSVDYEHALHHLYGSLSREQKIRETWVNIRGIEAWRRERFLVALEAALIRRGWIERWAVQVTVK